MTAKNDVTGDDIASKPTNDQYRSNYDLIFRKKASENDKAAPNPLPSNNSDKPKDGP